MAAAENSTALLTVEVVFCAAVGQFDGVTVQMPQGATVLNAVQASDMAARHGLQPADLVVGVWSHVCSLQAPLRNGDRVEIYRPLTVDPKEARRLRYKRDKKNKPVFSGSRP